MTRNYRIAVVLGVASIFAPSMLTPFLAAQEPATAPAAEAGPSAIAPEDQATKLQIANLFEGMHLRQQFEKTMGAMTDVARQQMDAQIKELTERPGAQITPAQKEATRKVADKFLEKSMHIMSIDDMIDQITTIYQRHFTKEDITAATEFYSSPAGQHMLSEQPAIMKEYMPIVMKRMNEQMQTLIEELIGDIQKALQEPTPAGK
jgi:hypothetical protein